MGYWQWVSVGIFVIPMVILGILEIIILRIFRHDNVVGDGFNSLEEERKYIDGIRGKV